MDPHSDIEPSVNGHRDLIAIHFPSVANWESDGGRPSALLPAALPDLIRDGRWSMRPEDLAGHCRDRWPLATKRHATGRILPQPAAVVWPHSTDDVSRLLQWAQRTGVPVVTMGGGSGVVGGSVPSQGDLVLDMSDLNAIVNLDDISHVVTVQAGLNGGELEQHLNQRGYTLGHYPQSLHLSTVGGWVATRASGTYSTGYGSIEDILLGLEAVRPTGEIVTLMAGPRSSAGPDLKHLLLGSEGTLGVITQVDLQVRPLPAVRRFRGLIFDDLPSGLATIRELAQHGPTPELIRLYDSYDAGELLAHTDSQIDTQRATCLLLVGWDGSETSVAAAAKETMAIAARNGGRDVGAEIGERWYAARLDVSALDAGIRKPRGLADTIEMSMLWRDVPTVYDAVTSALAPLTHTTRAHFSHIYRSGTSLYVTFFIEADDDDSAERHYLIAWRAVMEAVTSSKGSISHHHGIGLMRTGWMSEEHGSALAVLRLIKTSLDPADVLNPGKLLPPLPTATDNHPTLLHHGTLPAQIDQETP